MRECYSCESNITCTSFRKGRPHYHWYSNGIEGQWLCKKCCMKYITNPEWHPITSKKWNPIAHKKWNPINNRRRLNFTPLSKSIVLKQNPKIDVCNWCGAVKPFDCKRTDIHHDEDRYDLTNPLRYTIELCISCHNKARRRANVLVLS